MNEAERVKILFTDSDTKQAKFSEQYSISKNTLKGYLNGHRKLPYDILVLIANHFSVTTDYLLGITDIKDRPLSLSTGERALVSAYRTLSLPQKEIIIGNIKLMQEQNNR